MFRANLWENEGEPEKMREDAQASLEIFTELGDRWGMASAGTAIAQLLILDGDLEAAIVEYERAAVYLSDFGALSDATMMHLRLADLYVRVGNSAAAREQVALTREGDFQIGSRPQRMMTDATLATIALIEGDRATAEQFGSAVGRRPVAPAPVVTHERPCAGGRAGHQSQSADRTR